MLASFTLMTGDSSTFSRLCQPHALTTLVSPPMLKLADIDVGLGSANQIQHSTGRQLYQVNLAVRQVLSFGRTSPLRRNVRLA